MLSEVRALSNQGSLLTLPLGELTSGIFIKEIEGLDPVKATISSTSFPTATGEQYQSSKREARDIKIHFGLEADYVTSDIRGVRSLLYQYFMPRTWVDLTFVDSSGLINTIRGMTESCETPLFTQEPALDAVIRCFESDFVDPTPVTSSGSTVSSTFNTFIEYPGSVETGIVFQLNVNRDVDEFSLYNTAPSGEVTQMDFAWPLHSGDTVVVNCVQGQKAVTLTRAGVDSSILYAKSPQSGWIEFWPGENQFRAFAEGAAISYGLSYYNRYGGL